MTEGSDTSAVPVEVWRPVVGAAGHYEVSSLGRVRSVERVVPCGNGSRIVPGTVLSPGNKGNGKHLLVVLSIERHKLYYLVHRLVANAFLPNPDNLPEVNHLDLNPQNNRVSNLEWCTHKHNNHHARKHGRFDGRTNLRRAKKLTAEKILAIRARGAEGIPQSKIGQEFGVDQGLISLILRGKRWKDIP